MSPRTVAATTAAFVTVVAGVAGCTPAPARPSDPTAIEAHAIELRQEFGYRSDLAYVRDLESAAGTTVSDLGIPMTSAEDADLQRRRDLGNHLAGIESRYISDPTYAGAWMDQAAGGVLDVAFTRPASDATLAALTASLPRGANLRVSVARWSLSELNRLRRTVDADLLAHVRVAGTAITGDGVDVEKNAVRVAVPASTTEIEQAAVARHYGEMAEVEPVDAEPA